MSDITLLEPIVAVGVGLIGQTIMLASMLKVSVNYIEKNLARVEGEAARANARMDKLLENQPWQQVKVEQKMDDSKKVVWLQR